MVRSLNTLPAPHLIRIMPYLGEKAKARTILAILRSDAVAYQEPGSAAAPSADFERLELAAQYPVAYPVRTPFDPEALRTEPYRRLTEAAVGNMPTKA